MAIFLKSDAIFLHAPKTGGNWVTKVLKDQNLIDFHFSHKHSDASHLCVPQSYAPLSNRFGRLDKGYVLLRKRLSANPRPLIFTTVRNPFSWYESWFKYQSSPERNWKHWGTAGEPLNWHVNSELNAFGAEDFKSFVSKVVENLPGYVSSMFARYTSAGNVLVCKQESLRNDLSSVLQKTGASFDEAQISKTPDYGVSPKTDIEWDPVLRQRVYDTELPAFLRYGYGGDVL